MQTADLLCISIILFFGLILFSRATKHLKISSGRRLLAIIQKLLNLMARMQHITVTGLQHILNLGGIVALLNVIILIDIFLYVLDKFLFPLSVSFKLKLIVPRLSTLIKR